jgi:hypothetical protein
MAGFSLEGGMANFFDQFDAADSGSSGSGNFFDQFDGAPATDKPAEQNKSLLGDLGTDLKRGVQQLPGVVTGLADVGVGALTGRRVVDETADKIGEATGFQPSKWQEEARQEYSPQRQQGTAEIEQAWEEGDALDIAGAYASNPGNVAGLVAESLPQMLAGGAIGRGALVGGRAAGLIASPATAGQAARQAIVAGAGGEGAVIAGGTMDQIDREVDPRRAAAASAGAGVAGAALSGFGARLAQRMGLIDVESALAGGVGQVAGQTPGLARRVAGGALTEGVLEELPQSVQEQMLQNWAEQKPLMEGVPRAAVEGTLAGSAIGGAVNVARRPSEQMGLDPAAGPLSAAAATAVDGAPTGSQTPVQDAVRQSMLSGAPDTQPGGRYEPISQQLAIAQELFPADLDENGNLRFFRYDQDLQTMVEVPEAEALAAARRQLDTWAQQGFDPQDARGLDELVPQVDELPEQPPLATVESDTGPQQVEQIEQPLPLPTVESDTGPMSVEQVQPTPVAGDPNFEIRVQKNGRPFRGERDVRLLGLFNQLQREGESPIIVPHEGGWAVAVPREPVPPPAPLGLPAPSTMVVDSQGNAQRGATAPFVEPGAQVRPIGGPGMERQAPVGRRPVTDMSRDNGRDSSVTFARDLQGDDLGSGWVGFNQQSGSLGVPRADMPQIRADHRGAMVNFMNARGVTHEEQTVPARSLRPTQAEFSPERVGRAAAREGTERSILVSGDGYVLDGHHQWLAQREAGGDVKVIRLNAPMAELLPLAREFPSSFTDQASQEVQGADSRPGPVNDRAAGDTPAVPDAADNVAREPVLAERPDISFEDLAKSVFLSEEQRAAVRDYNDAKGREAFDMPAGLSATLMGAADSNRTKNAITLYRANGRQSNSNTDALNERATRFAERPLIPTTTDRKHAISFGGFSSGQFELQEINVEPGVGIVPIYEGNAAESEVLLRSDDVEIVRTGFRQLGEEDARREFGEMVSEPVDIASYVVRPIQNKIEQVKPAASENASPAAYGQRALSEQPAADQPAASEEAVPAQANDQAQDLPEILATPRKRYIERQAKAAGIKKGSPGYDQAIRRLQDQYEADVDRASAGITFEQYNELNSDSPEGVNRQAWEALREEYGAESEAQASPVQAPAASSQPKVIEDAGEKLGGARKDELRGVRERLDSMDDAAIANSTLSQLWPKDEINRIKDQFHAASYQVVRDIIPAKPRVPYKVRVWVDKVKAAREILKNLADIGADATVPKMREFSPGLRPIADKIELLMGIDRGQWGRIGRVGVASGKYNDGGTMVPGSWVEVEIDGSRKHFFGKKNVADALSDIRSAINLGSAPESRMKFSIYTDRSSGEVFIAKDGDKEMRRLKTFGDAKAARAFLADQHGELVTAWDAVKNRDNVTKADMRRDTNDERTGRNYRNGADITPEQFLEVFGFRGVEFGNWVSQGAGGADRQGLLNQAYDSFMDLAEVVGVPPKALSLGGRLGIGFGSRGRGRASAHFEPSNIVINMTKTRGAGSLAHEWFHALDNYFARQRGGEVPMERGVNAQQAYRNNNFITYRPEPLYVHKTQRSSPMSLAKLQRYREQNPDAEYFNPDNWQVDPRHPTGVRPEVERAFAELVDVLDQSPMARRSANLDKSPDAYWSQIIERGARAFETYVIAKLADQGYRNDYLANVRTLEQFVRSADRYPYLTPDEQGPVSDAFDKLFSTVQTRVDDDGAVVMYSRNSYRRAPEQGQGARAGQLRIAMKVLTGAWQNAPDVKVVQSIKDLPDRQRRQVERDGAFDVEGIFADGQVYLVADNLRDARHAAFVLQHEVLGHAGLQGAYGQRLTPLLMSIYNGNADMKSQADALVRRFNYKPAVAMEEVLADMAGTGSIQQQAFWPRLVTAMRNALRSIGFNMRWTEGDIQGLLANARAYIENGRRRAGTREAFSRDGRSGMGAEIVDEQGRLLAPNGKPSKLTQKQWHQARGENFKRWFGDWQAVAAEARLANLSPVRIRVPDGWRNLSIKELRAKAKQALDAIVKSRVPLMNDDIGEVSISRNKGVNKFISEGADPAKLLMAEDLRSAFKRAVYSSSRAPKDPSAEPNVAAFEKLLAKVSVADTELVAIFTVQRLKDGSAQFYNAMLVDPEIREGREETPAVSPRDTPIAGERATSAHTGVTDFVRRPLERVNPGDVSKLTDGNGEPLVVYHGSPNEFSVFDQARAGESTGHSIAPLGIFLTADQQHARGHAENVSGGSPGSASVMPLFASIKNPYRMSVADSQAIDTPQAAIEMRQKLEREGYDGIQLGDTGTWVAFYNSQVKSATNNTGAFDEIDPDIRYSRASQRDTEALRKLGLAGSEAQNLLDQVRNLTLGSLQAKLKDWSVRSEEGIFDGLAGIRRAEEAVGVTDVNQQGYVSARMASGIADVMHGVLHYAAPEWRDGIVSGKAGTRGVLEILGDLGADNLTPWLAWLGGKRAQLLKAQGRENNLTDTEIAELVAMGQGKEELFEKVYREYAQVNDAVLDLAQEAGLIDQDARAKWLTDYYVPFYRQDESEGIFTAPRSKRGLSHQTAAIKALKGGTLPTNDLLANMLAGWTKRIDAAMKNKALLEVVDNLQGSDYLTDESPRWQQVLISRDQIAQQIRKDRKALALAADLLDLPAGSNVIKVLNQLMKPESEGFEKLWTRVAPTDHDIVRVQRDGKSEYYRVNDESLLRGLKFMEGSVFNDPITKIGRTFKRILTTGVTASPDFILRNFIRDAAHAWVINKDGFTLGKDSLKGMRDALREDQDYRDLMFAGGSFQGGYVHGADPEASAQIIRRALEKKGFTRTQQDAYLGSLVNTPAKAAAMIGKGWQKYRELGDKVENANRLSTYKAAIAAGKSRRQASFEAKDLMDYSLRGNFAAAQWFTDVVPFLNARLQGLYKLGRAVKGDKTLLAKEVAMKGGYIALFSLMLAGLNDDDERYQALMDWDKDMHWHIFLGDEHFRIPKPFELGLIFGTVPERILHALTGTQDGGDLAKAVSRGVFDTLAFNPVPQFYQPIRELQANRNFFRDSPIEDMSDEGKLPEARYDERTSAIGRALGQVTGPIAGLSPKQVDHLIAAYTGTLGQYVLDMSSLVANSLSDAERPASRSGDIPILKVIYQGDSPRSTKYQSEFYDMMREADQLHRTIKSYREEGRVDAAEQLMAANREKLRHRPALGFARKQLGNVRNQMDAVYRDTRMTPEQKRQRLDALQRQSNQIAERIVKLAGGDF